MHRIAERWLHVDMDAFFVEVERLRDRRLRGRPVIVGGLGRRGVVSSASYEARARGVRSAMPTYEARRRCPDAIFLPPRHGRYREVSRRVFAVLESVTPFVYPVSIDEAFLDVAGLRFRHPSAEVAAEAVRAEIRARVGLPASVGAATSRVVAKVASSDAKPDGLLVVPAGSEAAFLGPRPITDLWGVGEVTRAGLETLGIATVGDLFTVPEALLVLRLGGHARRLLAIARGEDPEDVDQTVRGRSVSVESTFDEDLVGAEAVRRELRRLCARLGDRLYRQGVRGRTVTLKARLPDRTTITRSRTLREPVTGATTIYREAGHLLDRARVGEGPLRLLGVGVSGVTPTVGVQEGLPLAGSAARLDEVAAEIRRRFGPDAVMAGGLLPPPVRADRSPGRPLSREPAPGYTETADPAEAEGDHAPR